MLRAFETMDKANEGKITLDTLKKTYSVDQHCDIKAGKKTEDEVLGEFLESFEMHHSMWTRNPRDKNVTWEEFHE